MDLANQVQILAKIAYVHLVLLPLVEGMKPFFLPFTRYLDKNVSSLACHNGW